MSQKKKYKKLYGFYSPEMAKLGGTIKYRLSEPPNNIVTLTCVSTSKDTNGDTNWDDLVYTGEVGFDNYANLVKGSRIYGRYGKLGL